MKKYNVGISVILIGLACFIFYGTKDFDPIVSKAPGAGFWPRILALVLIILAIALLIETFFYGKNKNNNSMPIDYKSPAMKRVYIMIGIFAMYAGILYLGGFIIASLLFIPSVMYLLGERNKKILITVSVSITGIVYVFFTILLHITLPQPFFV